MKLTMDALKERADAVASKELLNSISGGTEGDCHVGIVEGPGVILQLGYLLMGGYSE